MSHQQNVDLTPAALMDLARSADARVGLTQQMVNIQQAAEGSNHDPSKRSLTDPSKRMLPGAPIWTLLAIAASAATTGAAWGDVGALCALLCCHIAVFAYSLRVQHAAESAMKATWESSARLRRGGILITIPAREIVLGDVIELTCGDVVPTDCVILGDRGMQVLVVDQSGAGVRDAPIERKGDWDLLLAGSAVVMGNATVVASAAPSLVQHLSRHDSSLIVAIGHFFSASTVINIALCMSIAITLNIGIERGHNASNTDSIIGSVAFALTLLGVVSSAGQRSAASLAEAARAMTGFGVAATGAAAVERLAKCSLLLLDAGQLTDDVGLGELRTLGLDVRIFAEGAESIDNEAAARTINVDTSLILRATALDLLNAPKNLLTAVIRDAAVFTDVSPERLARIVDTLSSLPSVKIAVMAGSTGGHAAAIRSAYVGIATAGACDTVLAAADAESWNVALAQSQFPGLCAIARSIALARTTTRRVHAAVSVRTTAGLHLLIFSFIAVLTFNTSTSATVFTLSTFGLVLLAILAESGAAFIEVGGCVCRPSSRRPPPPLVPPHARDSAIRVGVLSVTATLTSIAFLASCLPAGGRGGGGGGNSISSLLSTGSGFLLWSEIQSVMLLEMAAALAISLAFAGSHAHVPGLITSVAVASAIGTLAAIFFGGAGETSASTTKDQNNVPVAAAAAWAFALFGACFGEIFSWLGVAFSIRVRKNREASTNMGVTNIQLPPDIDLFSLVSNAANVAAVRAREQ